MFANYCAPLGLVKVEGLQRMTFNYKGEFFELQAVKLSNLTGTKFYWHGPVNKEWQLFDMQHCEKLKLYSDVHEQD